MKGKSTLAAAALVALLAGYGTANASDAGGGGGGSSDVPAQSYMQDLQKRADDQKRDLDRINGRTPSQPRTATAAGPRPQAAPASSQGADIRTAGGTIRVPASFSETLMPPGTAPSGWMRRLTLDTGVRIYYYADGRYSVRTPDGVWRHAAP